MQDPASPIAPGQLLAGKYRIEGILGSGGMGIVVAALHEQLNQRVAIKFLLPEGLRHPDLVARFAREARAAAGIKSEHVVRVSDVGVFENGAPYMVMEYLEGKDFGEVLRTQGTLPVEQAVDYLLQACEALAEAHSAGIVHRDLKPQNLFLARRRDGSKIVKVLDFGISKAMTGTRDASMTQTSAIMGSPIYMSPEQLRSTRAVDARADLWSLGVILHELLTGDPPFSAETMPQLCGVILSDPPPPLRQLRPDLPEALEAVILRCLAKDPAHRFANAAEFADAVAPFGTPAARHSAELVLRVLDSPGDSIPASAPATAHVLSQPSLAGLAQPTPPTPIPRGSTAVLRSDRSLHQRPTRVEWTSASDPPASPTPTPERQRQGLVVFAGAAVILLAGAAAAFVLIRSPPAAPAALLQLASESASIPPIEAAAKLMVPAGDFVEIRVAAKPPSARLFLDDAQLPGNPYSARVKGDGSSHRVRAEALGFQPQTHFVVFEPEKGVALGIELKADAAPRPVAAAPPTPRPAEPVPGDAMKRPQRHAPTLDKEDPYK